MSSGSLSARYTESGFSFDSKGTMFFSKDMLKETLAFLNSKVCHQMLELVCPTLDFRFGTIQQLPFIQIDLMEVGSLIQLHKEDWDLRENSWDFKVNPLIDQGSDFVEESVDLFKQLWLNKVRGVKALEENLNRKVISGYSLEESIDPQVGFNELSLLEEESVKYQDNIEINSIDLVVQFISYSVGCMFGRYSLDKDGLTLANQGETLQDYIAKIGKPEREIGFLPDDDNIIPILGDEWFEDDIVGRIHAFLKASFGEKNFRKNLDFVEECMGKNMRKYFTKDFYKDHIKRYKKRPIYWMFSSPKGHFNVLVYLHRYTPDTISTILNSYLREFIEKLNLQMKQLKQVEISGSASEQAEARTEMDKLDLMLDDCREYEEILFELASERIALDLDDGVLVNYNKMGMAVATVPGLNDKKAKDKVRKFDWIDTSQIR